MKFTKVKDTIIQFLHKQSKALLATMCYQPKCQHLCQNNVPNTMEPLLTEFQSTKREILSDILDLDEIPDEAFFQ